MFVSIEGTRQTQPTPNFPDIGCTTYSRLRKTQPIGISGMPFPLVLVFFLRTYLVVPGMHIRLREHCAYIWEVTDMFCAGELWEGQRGVHSED